MSFQLLLQRSIQTYTIYTPTNTNWKTCIPHSSYSLIVHWQLVPHLKEKFMNFPKFSLQSPHYQVIAVCWQDHRFLKSSHRYRKLRQGEAKITENQSIQSRLLILSPFYSEDSLIKERRQLISKLWNNWKVYARSSKVSRNDQSHS